MVLYIHQSTIFTRLNYRKQALETDLKKVIADTQEINARIAQLKNPATIKDFAIKELAMTTVQLNQIAPIQPL
jgi:cell division protein FtsB